MILFIFTRFKPDNTILYKLIVPNPLRKEALSLIHENESGHLGQLKSVRKTEEYFYWPNLRTDVRKYVKECITCQQAKASHGFQKPWQELPAVSRPLERVDVIDSSWYC